MNRLILGDCLEAMKKMDSESVDLVYLDPPFFSNRNYEVIWGDKGEIRSFEDRWSGGVDHYIAWLKERVAEMHRLLKPTGSIYLHCDWHADAYIRVYILDKIFGERNFKNKITWKRATTHNDSKQGARHFGRVCDYIYLYNKDYKSSTFNTIFDEYNKEYVENTYNKIESETGRKFKASDLSAAKPGGDTFYEWEGKFPPKNRFWAYSKLNMINFEKEGRLYYSSTGKPYLKHYLDEMPGVSVDDLWLNCNFKNKAERIGYPTQKPEAFMERIIKSASNEGDIVLDPFVGGGTTVAVADRLKRNWIGIDQSVAAVKVSEMRLNNQQNLFSEPFTVTLHKYDYDTLFNQNPKLFEIWIVERFGAKPNLKKGGDKGIDGRMQDGTPIQVKQSESVGSVPVRQLVQDARAHDKMIYEKNLNEGKPIAYFIAFSYGRGAVQEVARLKNEEGILINLVTVEEIVPIAKKPKLSVSFADKGTDSKGLREIEFTANVESENGIEMFSWDFNFEEDKPFKAEVLIDRAGQQSYKFKPGQHRIAVKAVDPEGMEAMEIIKLKVNGEVKAG